MEQPVDLGNDVTETKVVETAACNLVAFNPTRIRWRYNLISLRNLILVLLGATVFFDFIAGLLKASVISQFARALLLAALLYVIMRLDVKKFSFITALFGLIVLNSFITQAFSGTSLSWNSFFYDISAGLKILLFYCVYSALTALNRKGLLDGKQIEAVFGFAAIYTPLLYLMTLFLGVGIASYSNGSGFKSVFLSLNSINIAMLVLFIYSLDKVFSSRDRKWGVPAALNLVSLLLLGTKSSLLFALVVIAYYSLFAGENRIKRLFVIGCACVAVVLAFSSISFLRDSFTSTLERQAYLFETRSLFDYLTSGRAWMLEAAMDIRLSGGNPLNLLLGSGYYTFHHELAVASDYLSTNAVRPIEFDWADLLFSYGIIATAVVYGFIASIIHKAFCISGEKPFYLIALVVLVVFGCFGGHVFFEAISSTYLGMVLAGIKVFDDSSC